jgi:hypothetical protein
VARQLSLLSADVAAPCVDDLDGLLCGPGHVVVRGDGDQLAARVSVIIEEPWRASALHARLRQLDLADDTAPARGVGQAVSVRTRFDTRLLPLAARWTSGATPAAPASLVLDAGRLWWWAVAGGSADGSGYRLRLAPTAPQRWAAAGSALARAGLAGIFLGPRADGPAYRLVGTRRLARLADLVGEPPVGARPGDWPD